MDIERENQTEKRVNQQLPINQNQMEERVNQLLLINQNHRRFRYILTFLDSWIYNVVMHVIILVTGAIFFFTLRGNKNPRVIETPKGDNGFLHMLYIIFLIYLIWGVTELFTVRNRKFGILMGRISHVLGVTAIILLSSVVSPLVAVYVGMIGSLWTVLALLDSLMQLLLYLADLDGTLPDLESPTSA